MNLKNGDIKINKQKTSRIHTVSRSFLSFFLTIGSDKKYLSSC